MDESPGVRALIGLQLSMAAPAHASSLSSTLSPKTFDRERKDMFPPPQDKGLFNPCDAVPTRFQNALLLGLGIRLQMNQGVHYDLLMETDTYVSKYDIEI